MTAPLPPPSRIFGVNLHGERFRLHISGQATGSQDFARALDEYIGTAMDVDGLLAGLPDMLAKHDCMLSDVLDLRPAQPTGSLLSRDYLTSILRHRDPNTALALLVMAFEDADEDRQVQLVLDDPVWLQTSIRAVLDELDENRDQAIADLRRVMTEPVAYLVFG